MYQLIEIFCATAIVIACVASFRQLFVTAQNQHQYRKAGEGGSRKGLISYIRSKLRTSRSKEAHPSWPSSHSGFSASGGKVGSRAPNLPTEIVRIDPHD